jgi:hypothetical protein
MTRRPAHESEQGQEEGSAGESNTWARTAVPRLPVWPPGWPWLDAVAACDSDLQRPPPSQPSLQASAIVFSSFLSFMDALHGDGGMAQRRLVCVTV